MPASKHETTNEISSPAPVAPDRENPSVPAEFPAVAPQIGGGVSSELGRHLNELGRAEQQQRDRKREEELARLRDIQQFD